MSADHQITTVQNSSQEKSVSQPLIVAIGASAGGVEALETLFTLLPTDLNVTFIVVQHLSKDYESLMQQILDRKTKIPVETIEHQAPVIGRRVYVLPSGKDLQIDDNHFVLTNASSELPRRPIDLFFTSIAKEYRDNAVAVILTGTGVDGAIGCKQIHQSGGLVIVQNEQSAKFNGMPRAAIATGVADAIEPLEEIPNVLARYAAIVTGDETRREQFFKELNVEDQIKLLLHSSFQIDFGLYKSAMFERRLTRRMDIVGIQGKKNYLAMLENDPRELEELYYDLLIDVTEFFRDFRAFEELHDQLLPELTKLAAKRDVLRIWVCPCSTGQEAYSIAMLLDRLMAENNIDLDFKVFATDVSPRVLEFAQKGTYSREQLGTLSPPLVDIYFEDLGDQFRVRKQLRSKVIFAQHDVLQDAPFTNLDLVCCRNLLIYFKHEAQHKALSLFNFGLRSTGILFLGPSESVMGMESQFSLLSESANIYRKMNSVSLLKVNNGQPRTGLGVARKTRLTKLAANRSPLIDQGDNKLSNTYNCLLNQFISSGFLIDENRNVLHIFGDAASYFEVSAGQTTRSMLDLLPPTILTAVDTALNRVSVDPEFVADTVIETKDYDCQVTVQCVENDPLRSRIVKLAKRPQQTGIDGTSDAGSLTNLRIEADKELADELRLTKQQLHESMIHLRSLNEEFQSTNEELIASNEELQSTNEELRSVNEELCSVNSEHQLKIAELMELTDDMDNLLDSIKVDTIFLDCELRIRKFTLGLAEIFDLVEHDIGRRIDRLVHGLRNIPLVDHLKEVLRSRNSIELEVQNERGKWYLMRLLPYWSSGIVDGVVLTLVDIESIKQTEIKLSELSDVVRYSDDAILKTTLDGIIQTWNHGAEELFECIADAAVGSHICEFALEESSRQQMLDALDRINNGTRCDHLEIKATSPSFDEPIDVQMSLAPIYNSVDEVIASSVVIRDFSKQKQAELANLKAVQQRDQFLAMLSHELRNPINAMMSALGVFRVSQSPEDHKTARDTIDYQSNRLSSMLGDLLDVSRITHDKIKLKLEVNDFNQLTNEAIRCVEGRFAENAQTLDVVLSEETLVVSADADRIVQAQVNLLINASKYTPEGGNIRVHVFRNDDAVVFEVQDDGDGIPQELVENIFEVFFQADQSLDRQSGGMGLGLPLVKNIIESHGGTVAATSEGAGMGSSFTIQLPLCKDAAAIAVHSDKTDHMDAQEVDADLSGLKILLVEDNDSTRSMVKVYFECFGATVFEASNGLQGIEKYRESQPDVCVLDIGLPDCNGYEVAQQIREEASQPHALIALTGYGMAQDKEKTDEAGFDLHIVKPVDPEEVLTSILQLVKTSKVCK